MTPILPLHVTASPWRHRGAWMLAGAILGAILGSVAQPIASDPPVTITPFVVEVGDYLCRFNEGVRTIERQGRRSNVYTFHCTDGHATFNDTLLDERPK